MMLSKKKDEKKKEDFLDIPKGCASITLGISTLQGSSYNLSAEGYNYFLYEVGTIDHQNPVLGDNLWINTANATPFIQNTTDTQQIKFILQDNAPFKHILFRANFSFKELKHDDKLKGTLYDNNTLKVISEVEIPIEDKSPTNWSLFYLFFDFTTESWKFFPLKEKFIPKIKSFSKDIQENRKGSLKTLIKGDKDKKIEPEPDKLDLPFYLQKPKTFNVKVIKGNNLLSCDFNGFSDPYSVIYFGKQKQKSEIQYKTLNPVWNQQFDFIVGDEYVKDMQIEIWDWSLAKPPEFMGWINIPLNELHLQKKYTQKVGPRPGNEKKESKVKGTIEFIFDFNKQDVTERKLDIFGVDLNTIMLRKDESESIPRQIKDLVDYLTIHGPDVEGIFRISGVTEFRDKWIENMNQGQRLLLGKHVEDNCHNVSSIFKQWLKSLPTPLLTFELFEEFISILSITNEEEQCKKIASLLVQIPTTHRNVFHELMKLNLVVAQKSDFNKMIPENLAVVFAISILKPADELKIPLYIANIQKVYVDLLNLYPKYKDLIEKLLEDDESSNTATDEMSEKDEKSVELITPRTSEAELKTEVKSVEVSPKEDPKNKKEEKLPTQPLLDLVSPRKSIGKSFLSLRGSFGKRDSNENIEKLPKEELNKEDFKEFFSSCSSITVGISTVQRSTFDLSLWGYNYFLIHAATINQQNPLIGDNTWIRTSDSQPFIPNTTDTQQIKYTIDESSPFKHAVFRASFNFKEVKSDDKILAHLYDNSTSKVLSSIEIPIDEKGPGSWKLFYVFYDFILETWKFTVLKERIVSKVKSFATKDLQQDQKRKGSLMNFKSALIKEKPSLETETVERLELPFYIQKPKTLNVKVYKGKDLLSCDFNGFSDPFVVVHVGKQKQKSEIQYKTLNPVWNQQFDFIVGEEIIKEIQIEVWDWSLAKPPEFMGVIILPATEIQLQKKYNVKVGPRPGHEKKDSKVKGTIEFIFDFNKQDVTERKSDLFGVELTQIMLRKDESEGIPKQIKDMVDYLSAHGADFEGIFRISGETEFKEKWIQLLNQGKKIVLGKHIEDNCHNVSSIFKQWLKELPVPILTFDLFDDFLNILNFTNEDEKCQKIAALLTQIPLSHRNVFYELMKLNIIVAQKSEKNKMTPENLSIVFAISILKPKDESKLHGFINNIQKIYVELVNHFPKYHEMAEKLLDEDDDTLDELDKLME